MAEGGGLLNRYTVKSCIGGSNPPLSASSLKLIHLAPSTERRLWALFHFPEHKWSTLRHWRVASGCNRIWRCSLDVVILRGCYGTVPQNPLNNRIVDT